MSVDVELESAVRSRIAARAAEQALDLPWWRALAEVFESPVRPILAGVTAMALLAGLLLIGRESQAPPVTSPDAVRLETHFEAGKVRLAWTDGRGGTYRVRKSSDPRGLGGAETHAVKGNAWVDDDPGSSPVVFYQVD